MQNFYLRFNSLIWQNSDLSTEQKLIVNFVWNFCLKSGYCYASDDYMASVFGMRVDTIRTLVAELLSQNHIKILPHEERRLMTINTRLYPIEE